MTVTGSTHPSRFAMHQDPQNRQARCEPQLGHARRKGTIAGALCVAAFIVCCTAPTTFWLAQQGFLAWTHPIAAATEGPGLELCEASREATGVSQN